MQPYKPRNVVTGAAVNRYRVLALSGGTVSENGTVTTRSYAVAQDSADASGEEIDAVLRGPTKAVASAAISKGDLLQVASDGKVATDDGSTASRYLIGEALEDAAADGDKLEIFFDPDTTSQ